MELSQLGFLEELLAAPRRDNWTSFSNGVTEFSSNGWNSDSFDENPTLATFGEIENPSFECPFYDQQAYTFGEGFTAPEMDSSSSHFQAVHHEDYPSMVGDEEIKVEIEQSGNVQGFNMGLFVEKKGKAKRLEGQPSKNLMAERRRRKRLNDRLSMLRSIVPKISKMDRTSILGDTIDYMKELLERINKLKEDETKVGLDHLSLMNNMKELKPNEMLVRNSPKFDVEKREIGTRIDIRCVTKPGLMISTVNTLEALGLEIQQCVISCFNDFSMQASCSEVAEQRTLMRSEEIKQALFRNAGYGGKCL